MKKKLSEIQPGERFWLNSDTKLNEHIMVGKCKDGWAVQKMSCYPYPLVLFGAGDVEYEIISPTPERKYRPFANAAEFEPHRDRWVKWKDHEEYFFRAISYHDSVVWLAAGRETAKTWDEAFLEFTFDDGSPFGVLEE